jgi:hypothetical protein
LLTTLLGLKLNGASASVVTFGYIVYVNCVHCYKRVKSAVCLVFISSPFLFCCQCHRKIKKALGNILYNSSWSTSHRLKRPRLKWFSFKTLRKKLSLTLNCWCPEVEIQNNFLKCFIPSKYFSKANFLGKKKLYGEQDIFYFCCWICLYILSGHVTWRFSSSEGRRHVIPLKSDETDRFIQGVCRSSRSSRVT